MLDPMLDPVLHISWFPSIYIICLSVGLFVCLCDVSNKCQTRLNQLGSIFFGTSHNPREGLWTNFKNKFKCTMQFEEKNLSTFENDLKWQLFRATVKSFNYLKVRGREAEWLKSLAFINQQKHYYVYIYIQ